jgi:hypothetical protein
MKWENFGAFLSWLLRQEIFLTGFFLSEFHCSSEHKYFNFWILHQYNFVKYGCLHIIVTFFIICSPESTM